MIYFDMNNPFSGSRGERPLGAIRREGDLVCSGCKKRINIENLIGKNKDKCPICKLKIEIPNMRVKP